MDKRLQSSEKQLTPGSEPTRDKDGDQLPYTSEMLRKGLHLFALIIPIGMAIMGKPYSNYILIPAALLALLADYTRVRSQTFARWIFIIFGKMMREEEIPPVGGRMSINGATWVLITAATLSMIFPTRLGASAFGMFMISDAAAALIGRRFGKHEWGNTKRTVEGSIAFVITGIIIMLLIPSFDARIGTAGVIIAAAAEIPRKPLDDNFRAPFAAALVMLLLERLLVL